MRPLATVPRTLLGLSLLLLPLSLMAAAPASDRKPLIVEVLVPAEAVLEVEGVRLKTAGPVRKFETPPLPAGKSFAYTFKASLQGKTITRELIVGHERSNVLDLRKAWEEEPPPRTEVTPPLKVVPSGSFTLTLPKSITMQPGQEKDLAVTLARDHFSKPVEVRLKMAPEGISAAPLRIASDETQGRLRLKAARDAQPDRYQLHLEAQGDRLTREAMVQLTIEKPPQPPTTEKPKPVTPRPPLIEKPAPPLEPKLTLKVPDTLEMRAGTKKALHLSIRREHFKGPVEVHFKVLPRGVILSETTIAADKDTADVEVIAARNAKGTHEIEIIAEGPKTEATARCKLVLLPYVADKPESRLEVQVPERVVLRPGRAKEVEVTVKPKGEATFGKDAVNVGLVAPEGSKLTPKEWSVTANKEHTYVQIFSVLAAADAAPGKYALTVRARAGQRQAQARLVVEIEKLGQKK